MAASEARGSVSPALKPPPTLQVCAQRRRRAKVGREWGCRCGKCCRGKLILTLNFPSLASSISFFVYSFLCFFSFPLSSLHAPGQRKALTHWLLPGLHCQLFSIFHLRGGGYDEQEGGGGRRRESRGPTVLFFSPLPPPSASCRLITLTFIPLHLFLLIIPFSSHLCLRW